MMTFGGRLKHLRKETGKSQAQVAREIAIFYPDATISQTYLSTLELRNTAPREEILNVLADYYKVGATYFLGGAEAIERHYERSYWVNTLEALKNQQQKTRVAVNKIGYYIARFELDREKKDLDQRYGMTDDE